MPEARPRRSPQDFEREITPEEHFQRQNKREDEPMPGEKYRTAEGLVSSALPPNPEDIRNTDILTLDDPDEENERAEKTGPELKLVKNEPEPDYLADLPKHRRKNK